MWQHNSEDRTKDKIHINVYILELFKHSFLYQLPYLNNRLDWPQGGGILGIQESLSDADVNFRGPCQDISRNTAVLMYFCPWIGLPVYI